MTSSWLGAPIEERRLFGRTVMSVRSQLLDIFAATGSTPPPTGENYTHTVWGDTTRLPRPAALTGPIEITDYLTNATINGPAGQVATRQTIGAGLGLDIDADGGDIWLKPRTDGSGHIDFPIVCRNFRNVRLTGLTLRAGGESLRSGSAPGELIEFKETDPGVGNEIYIEGCDCDGEDTVTFDIFASNNLNFTSVATAAATRHAQAFGRIAIVNTRFVGVGHFAAGGTNHADFFHIQPSSLIKKLEVVNLWGHTEYQGVQANWPVMAKGTANKPVNYSAFFPTSPVNLQPEYIFDGYYCDAWNSGSHPTQWWFGSEGGYPGTFDYFPRIIIKGWNQAGRGCHFKRAGSPVWPIDLGAGTQAGGWASGAPVSDGEGGPAYITQYASSGDALPTDHPCQTADNVGANYVSMFGADGSLLTEA